MVITEMQEIMSSLGYSDRIIPEFYRVAIEPAYNCSGLDKSEWVKNWLDCGGLDAQKAWIDRDKQIRKGLYIAAHQSGINIDALIKDFTEKEILVIKLQCGQLDPAEQQKLAGLL